MTGKDLQKVIDFESNLKPGDKVMVRWTNTHHVFSGPGTISKVNKRSVRVTLDQKVGWLEAGFDMSRPRYSDRTWSSNNRVEPMEGYNFES